MCGFDSGQQETTYQINSGVSTPSKNSSPCWQRLFEELMQKPLKTILVKINEITILSECSPHMFIKYFHFKCAKSQPQPVQKYQYLHRNIYIVARKKCSFLRKTSDVLGGFCI